jgi:3-hydroxybutyryl-CoA dehydratase
VRIGDTITVRYTLARLDQERGRAYSDIEVTNQAGALVLVATHVLAFIQDEPPAQSP